MKFPPRITEVAPKPWEFNSRVNPHVDDGAWMYEREDEGPPVKDVKTSKFMVDLWKLILKWSAKWEKKKSSSGS